MGTIICVRLGYLVSTSYATRTSSALTLGGSNSWSSLQSYLHVVGDKTPRWMVRGGIFNFLNIFSVGGGFVLTVLIIVSRLGVRCPRPR